MGTADLGACAQNSGGECGEEGGLLKAAQERKMINRAIMYV